MNALRQIRWVALIVSWVVDIGGSNLFAIVYFGALVAVGRLTLTQLGSPDFPNIVLNDPVMFATSMAGGTFFSERKATTTPRHGRRTAPHSSTPASGTTCLCRRLGPRRLFTSWTSPAGTGGSPVLPKSDFSNTL